MRTIVLKVRIINNKDIDWANIVATACSIEWHGYTTNYIDKYDKIKDKITVYNVSPLPNSYYRIDFEYEG